MEGIMSLCDAVRETAFAIHKYFRHGYPEKVYENALANRLRKLGLAVERQKPIAVHDEDGTCVGHYLTDMLINGALIVELKAVSALSPEHEAQVLGYLKCARLEHALLINFGARSFQVRKYAQLSDESGACPDHSLFSLCALLCSFVCLLLPYLIGSSFDFCTVRSAKLE